MYGTANTLIPHSMARRLRRRNVLIRKADNGKQIMIISMELHRCHLWYPQRTRLNPLSFPIHPRTPLDAIPPRKPMNNMTAQIPTTIRPKWLPTTIPVVIRTRRMRIIVGVDMNVPQFHAIFSVVILLGSALAHRRSRALGVGTAGEVVGRRHTDGGDGLAFFGGMMQGKMVSWGCGG